jgi:hypothetical protein
MFAWAERQIVRAGRSFARLDRIADNRRFGHTTSVRAILYSVSPTPAPPMYRWRSSRNGSSPLWTR